MRKEDVLALCVEGKPIELALVLDEQGRFQGLVTRTDLLEAIAGEFPDEGE